MFEPPADRGPATAGDGPAEAGPVLLGVIRSFVSSASSPSILLDVLAKLLWPSFTSDCCGPSDNLEPPSCVCRRGTDVDESIVLVRLPPTLDMLYSGLGVLGCEYGVLRRSRNEGERGVLGSGFSLALLWLRRRPYCKDVDRPK